MKLITYDTLILFGYIMSVLADYDVEKPVLFGDKENQEKWKEEWDDLSDGNKKKVYNFGIGSLTSFGSRQYTDAKKEDKFGTLPYPMSPAYPAKAKGIRRSFNDCWRYAAMTATVCNEGKKCPIVDGVIFEVESEESYLNLRERESAYQIVKLKPLPSKDIDVSKSTVFAWGENIDYVPVGKCYMGGDATEMKYPAQVAQSYWDFIIGGILSWDGELLKTERYTWDLDAELSFVARGIDMKNYVHKYPTVGDLNKRRELAVSFVRSTEHSSYDWVDDRKCPFTGNANIVMVKDLEYPPNVFGKGVAFAFGTVSPMTSETFYQYVDQILIDGGWEYGARQSIHNRKDPCSYSGDHINRRDDDWVKNPYYKDVMDWYLARPRTTPVPVKGVRKGKKKKKNP